MFESLLEAGQRERKNIVGKTPSVAWQIFETQRSRPTAALPGEG